MTDLNDWFDTVRAPLLGLVLLSSVGAAMATLGRAPSPLPVTSTAISVPVARMSAAAPVVLSSFYTLHETRLENGTTVREYATPDGLVFAVAWRGPVLPDLTVLLGGYFNTFKLETEQSRRLGKRGGSVNIERDDLVVRSNGRMRNFFGHAYAPALVPTDVNIKDVLQ